MKDSFDVNYSKQYKAVSTGVPMLILDRFLKEHKENEVEKKWGDKCGRFITGWDAGRCEPVISYSFGYVPFWLMRHNTADIPAWYYQKQDRREHCRQLG